MKVFVQFDAYASDYEIKGELGGMRGIDGVVSVTLMRKVSGDGPRFCIDVEVADDKVDAVTEKLNRYQSQYAGQISNVAVKAFSPV